METPQHQSRRGEGLADTGETSPLVKALAKERGEKKIDWSVRGSNQRTRVQSRFSVKGDGRTYPQLADQTKGKRTFFNSCDGRLENRWDGAPYLLELGSIKKLKVASPTTPHEKKVSSSHRNRTRPAYEDIRLPGRKSRESSAPSVNRAKSNRQC